MGVTVKSEKPLLIGELSRATGASPRSLRHYEAKGLITARRGDNGYRRYDPDATERVRSIRRLLAVGFNLDSIGVLLPCLVGQEESIGMCPTVAAEVRRLLGHIDERSSELERQRAAVTELIGRA